VEKVRKIAATVGASFLILSCGGGYVDLSGGGSSGSGSGGSTDPKNYYVRITEFSITPTVISQNQSFTIYASFDYSTFLNTLYVTIFFTDSNGNSAGDLYIGCLNDPSLPIDCVTSVLWSCSYSSDTFYCSSGSQTDTAYPISPGEWKATLMVEGYDINFDVMRQSRSLTINVQ
jgi:hypothetical protein